MLEVGDKALDFSLPNADNTFVSLKDLLDKTQSNEGGILLYFYPKNDTSGCTQQAIDFTQFSNFFTEKRIIVVGISKDSPQSHKKFQIKYGLNFLLLADQTTEVCQKYKVWVEKSLYGRKYFGIERTTFLINAQGIIEALWSRVKVKGHLQQILKTLNK